MNLLVATLKWKKTHFPSFSWKFVLALVENNYNLQIGYGVMVGNGAFSLTPTYFWLCFHQKNSHIAISSNSTKLWNFFRHM